MSAPSNTNPPLSFWVRVYAIANLLVLGSGVLLLVMPELIVNAWPWRLAPYAARFLGAIYTAEAVALLILLVVNRWAPGRMTLWMGVAFTLVVTVVSAFHLEQFDFGRRGPWGWFVVYAGSGVAAAVLLWLHRHLTLPGRETVGGWRVAFVVEAVLLGGYSLLMLVSPRTATAFWPWPADDFTARVYSGMFAAAATGAFILSRRGATADFVAFGVTQVVLGLAAGVGVFLVARGAPPYVPPDVTYWILGCAAVVVMGGVALAAAKRPAVMETVAA